MRGIMIISVAAAALVLGACTEHTAQRTLEGGLIGGGVGLVAGAIYGHPVESAAKGAVLGAATGAIIGTVGDLANGRNGYRY